jgi:hypothetical protein
MFVTVLQREGGREGENVEGGREGGRGGGMELPSAFSSHLMSKVGNILDKSASLRINLNIDDTPITSKSHTHPSHS